MPRPREFDPEQALDRAMQQFWAKGYYDTSIRELVECTGVNYYGLYSVFQDKHGLFLAALDRYQRTVTAEILDVLKTPGPLYQVLKTTLEKVSDLMRTSDGPVGCLMANTALELAPTDREAHRKVSEHRDHLERAFRARLSADDGGPSRKDKAEVDRQSEFLATTVYTIGMLVRSGKDGAFVSRHIEMSLRSLG